MNKPNERTFIRLWHDLVRSEVWADLSPNATRLLIGIWDQHNGHNNGELRFGKKQAMRLLRCSSTTAMRTFVELQDAGLIEVVEKGSFEHKERARKGMATAWRITAIKSGTTPSRRPTASCFPTSSDGVSDA